ncbi:hypothetical protein [Burkholderia cenocepacia]|uniref:hypothetical protein n=1 Tax=Burkholderia cenocepacia TaxID=95486 RepID=UPI0028758669|nr:hypothetical protein [Burkholderia cenocepacia]MDS0850433.1 hypothetical protein [Burkholderia cenocepacia]
MNLDAVFVESGDEKGTLASAHGNSSFEARGSYNTLDFVVRLRPDLHRILEEQGGEVSMRECDSWDAAQAFSTYLHETIHWWLHVGTSAGLMLSFLQPAHAHMNRKWLDDVLTTHGPVKPLLGLAEKLNKVERPDRALNVVINNWHDLDFFRQLVINPTGLVKSVAEHPYFESVGHSYRMAIGAASWLIGATIDPNYEALPHPRDWEADMATLRESKVEGFYFRSPIGIPPLGMLEILEGQARLSQIQYLYGASGGRLSWDDFRRRGMLSSVYVRAFETFLKLAGVEWPSTVDDPIVGLFLLICDVALSPSEGLFLPMTDPSALIWSTDPGWRFTFLCRIAKEEGEEFKRSIKKYSADEYWEVSERLSQRLLSPSPRQLAEAISRYAETHPAWIKLVEEDDAFEYQEGNFPIRVLLGRFTRVQRDKLKTPQFFCWPGMCLTSFRQALDSETVKILFSEHQALFLDRADRDVYPRLVPNRDEKVLQHLFDQFYVWVSMYEMTRQWLVEDGPFEYDYGWLTSKFSNAEIKSWADNNFKVGMSVHPDVFAVLR